MAIIEYLDDVHPARAAADSVGPVRSRTGPCAVRLIVASDAHPLVVPRIRDYLEHELKLDEPTRLKWIRHWSNEALTTLETHLSRDQQTGRYCHSSRLTMADICVVTHAVGAKLFEVDLKPYPTVTRIVDECLKIDAFARAHPLKQPGAPAGGGH